MMGWLNDVPSEMWLVIGMLSVAAVGELGRMFDRHSSRDEQIETRDSQREIFEMTLASQRTADEDQRRFDHFEKIAQRIRAAQRGLLREEAEFFSSMIKTISELPADADIFKDGLIAIMPFRDAYTPAIRDLTATIGESSDPELSVLITEVASVASNLGAEVADVLESAAKQASSPLEAAGVVQASYGERRRELGEATTKVNQRLDIILLGGTDSR